ncbi:MAG TPA: hypothetical protein VGF37_00870 [Chthoniobacterales bacterium]
MDDTSLPTIGITMGGAAGKKQCRIGLPPSSADAELRWTRQAVPSDH